MNPHICCAIAFVCWHSYRLLIRNFSILPMKGVPAIIIDKYLA
ncbi:hypothetical protein [Nostoc sp. FACHB-280]|nr:hypothetical protein [Nostoc sp. FACHB-280]